MALGRGGSSKKEKKLILTFLFDLSNTIVWNLFFTIIVLFRIFSTFFPFYPDDEN